MWRLILPKWFDITRDSLLVILMPVLVLSLMTGHSITGHTGQREAADTRKGKRDWH